MAITDAEIIGYRGTVDEVAYAMLSAVPEGRVGGEGDWLVTGVPGSRRVSVALGRGKHAGVLAITDRAYVRDVPTPTAGQWFLAVATRTWHRDGVPAREFDFRLVAGPTTTQDAPTAPPLLLPSTLANEAGRELDQVLAWVWTSANRNDVLTWDWRHDRAKPFAGRTGQGWSGTSPRFTVSNYSEAGGRIYVEQLVEIHASGVRVGNQLKRPFLAETEAIHQFSQEGRGAVRRTQNGSGVALFGMTRGQSGTEGTEVRVDLMSANGTYVGQAALGEPGPFGGWRIGDYLYLKYDYRPVWPLTPTP